jgi:hypothetical protein
MNQKPNHSISIKRMYMYSLIILRLYKTYIEEQKVLTFYKNVLTTL